MSRLLTSVAVLTVAALVFAGGWFVGVTGLGRAQNPASLPEVERRLIAQMSGAALIGGFTVTGSEDRAPTPDRYDLYSVDKIGEDQWRFNAKIGETGLTVPVIVTMKFVDDTPVILLTDVTIPGLGAGFSARVLFYGDLYAGTWSHGDARSGHMFGRIARAAAQ